MHGDDSTDVTFSVAEEIFRSFMSFCLSNVAEINEVYCLCGGFNYFMKFTTVFGKHSYHAHIPKS